VQADEMVASASTPTFLLRASATRPVIETLGAKRALLENHPLAIQLAFHLHSRCLR
jgi:hypothetical protein